MINVKKSINRKIIISISAVLAVIMLIANMCIFLSTYNQIISINKNNMEILLTQIKNNYKNMIKIQYNDALKISTDNSVVSFLNKTDENMPISLGERNDLYSQLKVLSSDSGFDENVFVTDKNGIIAASSNSDFINYDMRSFDYVQNALKGNECISDIYTSSVTSKPVVTFIFPVTDKEGRIIGTAGKSVYAYYFSDQLDKFKFYNKGYIFIVNNTDNIIYHPDKYYINKKIDIKSIQNILKNKNTFKKQNIYNLQYSNNDSRYFSEYVSIPELKCLVFLTIPNTEIVLECSRSGIIISIMTLIMIFLVVFILKLVINKFLSPLKMLTNNTMQINNGNLLVKNNVSTEDELGQLSVCFNNMAESIKNFIFDIKKMLGEIININKVLNNAQENTFENMNMIKNKSDTIIRETEKINKSIDYSYSSFLKMSSSFSDMNQKMLTMTEQANKINQINSKSIDSVYELKNINITVNKSIDDVNISFSGLSNNLNDIKGIVNLVSKISKKIHILSLNTSIEAARAGEYGNGFMVVADEIKKMSFDVQSQMGRITDIVNGTADNINITNNKLEAVNNVSKKQIESIDNTIENHQRIVDSVQYILNGIENIGTKMTELDSDKNMILDVIKEVSGLVKDFNESILNISGFIERQYSDMHSIMSMAGKLNDITFAVNDEINKYKVE